MSSPIPHLDVLEDDLKKLSERIPDFPLNAILLCRLIMRLGRDMSAMLEYEIRPFGLVEAEFRVLTTLMSHPEGNGHPSELCLEALQTPANMSRIGDALVSRNLITRILSELDRRRIVLQITPHGEDLVRQLLPNLFVPIGEMLMDCTVTEQRELINQLKLLELQLRA